MKFNPHSLSLYCTTKLLQYTFLIWSHTFMFNPHLFILDPSTSSYHRFLNLFPLHFTFSFLQTYLTFTIMSKRTETPSYRQPFLLLLSLAKYNILPSILLLAFVCLEILLPLFHFFSKYFTKNRKIHLHVALHHLCIICNFLINSTFLVKYNCLIFDTLILSIRHILSTSYNHYTFIKYHSDTQSLRGHEYTHILHPHPKKPLISIFIFINKYIKQLRKYHTCLVLN